MPAQPQQRIITEDKGAPSGKPPAKPKPPVTPWVKGPPPQARPNTHQTDGDFLLIPKGPPAPPPSTPSPSKGKGTFSSSASVNLGGQAIADLARRTHDTPAQAAKFLYASAARYDQEDDNPPRFRQDVSPTSGQGIDACGLYGSNFPSLVYACRMGLVPEPEYRVIYFGGSSENILEPGPDPRAQAPIWADWATFPYIYQYPGIIGENEQQEITEYVYAPNGEHIEGKQGQAYAANISNQDLSSGDYLIVVGYSAGADAALMFASRYTGNAFISDVVLLGPTMSGGLDPSGLSPNQGSANIGYPDSVEWQRMIESLLASGTDVFVFDDIDSDRQPDYTGFNPTLSAGRFDYVGPLSNVPNANASTISADPNRSGVTAAETLHFGGDQLSPLPTNLNYDLLRDVIHWINQF